MNKFRPFALLFATVAALTLASCAKDSKPEPDTPDPHSPELVFADNAVYDIPPSVIGTAIININVSGGVSGGKTPYTFSATGLPAGISIASATGVISGTPTTAAAAGTATVTVKDSATPQATKSITIAWGAVVAAGTPLNFADNPVFDLPAMTVGVPIAEINVALGVSGGTPPYSFWLGNAPDGITINSTGVISGTPTKAGAAGVMTVGVTDATAAESKSITVAYGVISSGVIVPVDIPCVSINGVTWAAANVAAPGEVVSAPEASGMLYYWNNNTVLGAAAAMSSAPIGGTRADNYSYWLRASDPCPTGWRVPDRAQLETLLDATNVSRVWMDVNGVNGCRFTDRNTGKSVFLPAAGWRDKGTAGYANQFGFYWAASPGGMNNAGVLTVSAVDASYQNYSVEYGLSVRCVRMEGLDPEYPLRLSSEGPFHFTAKSEERFRIIVISEPGAYNVEITKPAWCHADPVLGGLVIYVDKNTTPEERDASVIVTAGTNLTKTVKVTQDAAPTGSEGFEYDDENEWD